MTNQEQPSDPDDSIKENKQDSEEDLHVIVSEFNRATWIKPSRSCSRQQLIGLLMDGVYMLQRGKGNTVRPEDCPLPVFLIVDPYPENP